MCIRDSVEFVRHRRERPAAIVRREPVVDHRRQRTADRHARVEFPVAMRVAFLGTGQAARLHTGTMKAMAPDVERWYASRDAARAERARDEFDGKGAFGSYEEALADPAVEAVLVLV